VQDEWSGRGRAETERKEKGEQEAFH
jgi:hypothetical protein